MTGAPQCFGESIPGGGTPMSDPHDSQISILKKTVTDARRLLDYAVSRGLIKDSFIITAIINIEAKLASGAISTHSDIEDFLKAYNTLSEVTGGVSGDSLSPEAANDALHTKRIYTRTLIALLILLVPISTVTLTGKRLIDDTLADINWICSNQPQGVCWEQPFPQTTPQITTLQKDQSPINDPSDFPSDSASLLLQKAQVPINDPLSSPLDSTPLSPQKVQAPLNSSSDLPLTINGYDTVVRTYQIQQRMNKVWYVVYFFKPHKIMSGGANASFFSTRVYADQIRVEFDFWYNTFAGCLLPIAFAALGAVTFGLRDLRQRLEDRTWTSQGQTLPFLRIVIALLVGFLISLFSEFTIKTGLTTIALAFIIGYSVDVFFTFIDSIVTRLKTPLTTSPKPAGV
jgi:hypothetical protein